MSNCIFCDALLDNNTKSEHVLLNALGGRKTTSRVICSQCNNVFGNSIDKELASQFMNIRNMFRVTSGTGKPAPVIKRVQAGSDVLNFHSDGEIELVQKPFTYKIASDGTVKLDIKARSLEHVAKLIPDIAATLKVPEVQVRDQILAAKIAFVERRPGAIQFQLSFGGKDAIRSAAKACMILWALKVGSAELANGVYDSARHFVKEGSDEFLKSRTSLDLRRTEINEYLVRDYGPLFNAIFVQSDQAGRVIGHFTVFNIVGFQVVLAEAGGAPGQKAMLVSNPLNPKIWSDRLDEQFDMQFAWLEQPVYEGAFHILRERMSDVLRSYYDLFQPQAIQHIIDSVFKKYGISENDPIEDTQLQQITYEISSRLAAYAVGMPYEGLVAAEELKKHLPEKTDS